MIRIIFAWPACRSTQRPTGRQADSAGVPQGFRHNWSLGRFQVDQDPQGWRGSNLEPQPTMPKLFHEIRDPIHVFIRLDNTEREVLDSPPIQRLRHIHQLALSHLIYPGATHKRLEHSLGVMHLAGQIFDTVVERQSHKDEIRDILPEVEDKKTKSYWRTVLRLAALCHDVGHLPFSHAAEEELLPDGWDHEQLTEAILKDNQLKSVFDASTPPIRVEDVVKLAIGRKAKGLTFSNWEAILSEIVVGDVFGADRMDYLLRDSHHAGVAYGRFDHHRLIDTMRILPTPSERGADARREPALGIEEGGLQSAESLLLARYLMYSQVYFHPIRRIYDQHLKDFLAAHLGGVFSIDIDEYLNTTDHEVMVAILNAARRRDAAGHDAAERIALRDHFRVLYSRTPEDLARNRRAVVAVFRAAREKFGSENVRKDEYSPRAAPGPDFPVMSRNGEVVSSVQLSRVLSEVPPVQSGYVFIRRELRDDALRWLKQHREGIVAPGDVQ